MLESKSISTPLAGMICTHECRLLTTHARTKAYTYIYVCTYIHMSLDRVIKKMLDFIKVRMHLSHLSTWSHNQQLNDLLWGATHATQSLHMAEGPESEGSGNNMACAENQNANWSTKACLFHLCKYNNKSKRDFNTHITMNSISMHVCVCDCVHICGKVINCADSVCN